MQYISHTSSNYEIKALVMLHTDFIELIGRTGYDGSKNCLFLTDDAILVMEGKLFKTKA